MGDIEGYLFVTEQRARVLDRGAADVRHRAASLTAAVAGAHGWDGAAALAFRAASATLLTRLRASGDALTAAAAALRRHAALVAEQDAARRARDRRVFEQTRVRVAHDVREVSHAVRTALDPLGVLP